MTSKKDRKYNNILKIHVDSTPKRRVLRTIQKNVLKGQKFYIVTPNPEHILIAQDDSEFKSILNSANINIPDGVGLVAADRFLRLKGTKNRLFNSILYLLQGMQVGFSIVFNREWLERDVKVIRGRDLFEELVRVANKRGWRVFLLGGRGRIASLAGAELKKNYKKVKIETHPGCEYDREANPNTREDKVIHEDTLKRINEFEPHLLFIALGAPKQEYFIKKYLKDLNVVGAMVVGGAFDYYSGVRKMPPKILANAGLEWLWRLATGSNSLGRILISFPAFPFKVFMAKLSQKGGVIV
ncbi:MAG: WecB/TagA/CpsF family glycosyltransferase [Candidatus Woesebacteria bacterium]|jgi:N-acetylglucosaminyldiphosphoundecaprenol N-acetyl-beta-D-mannosaminyltransferase